MLVCCTKVLALPNLMCWVATHKGWNSSLMNCLSLYTNYKSLYCMTLNHCLWLKKCIVTCTKSRTPNILHEFMFLRIAIYMTTFGYSIPGRTKSKERRVSRDQSLLFFRQFPFEILIFVRMKLLASKEFLCFPLDAESSCATGIVRFGHKEDIFMSPDFMCFQFFWFESLVEKHFFLYISTLRLLCSIYTESDILPCDLKQ